MGDKAGITRIGLAPAASGAAGSGMWMITWSLGPPATAPGAMPSVCFRIAALARSSALGAGSIGRVTEADSETYSVLSRPVTWEMSIRVGAGALACACAGAGALEHPDNIIHPATAAHAA
ncbi:MAG: hypothetical protein ABSA67_00860 [Candidatus Brocadiia bacterium]